VVLIPGTTKSSKLDGIDVKAGLLATSKKPPKAIRAHFFVESEVHPAL